MYYSPKQFKEDIDLLSIQIIAGNYVGIYPVPRGGIPIAIALSEKLNLPLTDILHNKVLVVDDVVDSGRTRKKYKENDFACFHIKKNTPKSLIPEYYVSIQNDWIEYWWERMSSELPAEDAVVRLIQSVGEDIKREGLLDTPKRVVKSWEFLFSGYKVEVEDILTLFTNDNCDQIVLLKDIEMFSMCEHHLLPFCGKAHVAYIPDKTIIGISKLARLIEMYSRRMQIQERIGEQVTLALMKYLKPKGAACIIEAAHFCMRMRGVQKQNSIMITSSLKGVFLDNLDTRQELLKLLGL